MPSLLSGFVSDFDQLTPGQRRTIAVWVVFVLSLYTVLCFTVLMLVHPVFCLACVLLCCCCCVCTSPVWLPVVEEVVPALLQQEQQQAREART